jgi:hypothetical protein
VLAAERVSDNALQFTGRRTEGAEDAERARTAGLTLTSHVAMSATFPGFATTSAELIAHCPEFATTRSTAAYALEPPARPTIQRKLQRQGRATKSRAAWRLPRLTFRWRERPASAMTPRRLWVDPGGSAAGPKPGADSFTLELGGLAVQELLIRAARMRTHESPFGDAAEP